MTWRPPKTQLLHQPVNARTVELLAYRTHRRRTLGYQNVSVPVPFLEKLLEIAAKAIPHA
jgi:hypothetical protein